MAFFGVLNPRPTSLYHLRPPLPTFDDLTLDLEFKKMCGCFWKALSDWTVNSVAIFAVCCCRGGREVANCCRRKALLVFLPSVSRGVTSKISRLLVDFVGQVIWDFVAVLL